MTRGTDNFNPGNIRISSTPWTGKITPSRDHYFETFDTMADGIRAMAIILLNYSRLHGLNTIRGLISRWAPPDENATDAYIQCVADDTGFDADANIDLYNAVNLASLVKAIIHHENGADCSLVSDTDITAGVNSALS